MSVNFYPCIYVLYVALWPHSETVVGSTLTLWPFCEEFARSPCVCVGFFRALRLPPKV